MYKISGQSSSSLHIETQATPIHRAPINKITNASSAIISANSSDTPQGIRPNSAKGANTAPRRALQQIKDAVSHLGRQSSISARGQSDGASENNVARTSITLATLQPSALQNAGQGEASGLMQPRRAGGRYRNEGEGNPVLTHQKQAFQIGWKTLTSKNPYNAPNETLERVPPLQSNEGLSAQWLGHASFLIQAGGHNILTDPIFGDLGKVGPLPALYPRKSPVGVEPSKLPPVDIVLISHSHRDHLDEASLRHLVKKNNKDIHVMAPAGSSPVFGKMGFKNVQSCSWWTKFDVNAAGKDPLSITFVPAKHWSGLKGIDANKHLWGGFVISNEAKGTTTYFAGDTAMNVNMFHQIKSVVPNIDLALMPIGPCAPRHLMKDSHMDPAEAVAATDILQPKHVVPMHFGTFRLGPDSATAPKDALITEWNREERERLIDASVPVTTLHILKPSGRFDLEAGVTQPSVLAKTVSGKAPKVNRSAESLVAST